MRSDEWPTFKLVKIAVADDVPHSAAEELHAQGVPASLIGRRYGALEEADLVDNIAGRRLVAFGTAGLTGRVCMDASTKQIVHVPTVPAEQVNPVNADLSAFNACAMAVIARFPFYSLEAESDEMEAVAEELRVRLADIDQVALSHNGFWEAFLDDLIIGDYATEEVMGGD